MNIALTPNFNLAWMTTEDEQLLALYVASRINLFGL